jgi:hypothetical protein
MKNYLKIVLAVVVGLFVISTSVQAIGEAEEAQFITQEEAAKKYPPPKGGYPIAVKAGTPGYFTSPYSSKVFNCKKIKNGGLVLDPHAKQVFVRP